MALAVAVGVLLCACAPVAPQPPPAPAQTATATVAAAAPQWVRAILAGSPVWAWGDVTVEAVTVPSGQASAQASRQASGQVAVVGRGPADGLAEIRDDAVAAVVAVRSRWHRPWSGRLLVVVPGDRAEWAEVAGVDRASAQGSDAAVAPAMTVGAAPGSAHVILDPQGWAGASAVGRRALLIHEAVHVAVWADPQPPSPPAPQWLAEGFAQYVAYGHLDVSPRTVAPELLRRVRAEGPPDRLPSDAELSASGPARLDAYALAWLATVTLADLAGDDAPARAMAGGGSGAAGVGTARLTLAWQADLRRLAAASPRN